MRTKLRRERRVRACLGGTTRRRLLFQFRRNSRAQGNWLRGNPALFGGTGDAIANRRVRVVLGADRRRLRGFWTSRIGEMARPGNGPLGYGDLRANRRGRGRPRAMRQHGEARGRWRRRVSRGRGLRHLRAIILRPRHRHARRVDGDALFRARLPGGGVDRAGKFLLNGPLQETRGAQVVPDFGFRLHPEANAPQRRRGGTQCLAMEDRIGRDLHVRRQIGCQIDSGLVVCGSCAQVSLD